MIHILIKKADELLKNRGFEYAFCGGFAIELFLGRSIRKHGDIDVFAYWYDRDKIIVYMQSLGWNVYEMCGDGIAHKITDIKHQFKEKRNIFCFIDGCDLVKLTPHDEKDMYYLDFDHREQTNLDFIEFLFNDRNGDSLLYARNENISLPLSKAIMSRDGIPYLAPEMVLLYKSTDTEREGYQLDHDTAYAEMSIEQKSWLQNSLRAQYPAGHKWLEERIDATPYYLAYEERYKAVYATGATLWGHSPDDDVLVKTLTDWVNDNGLQGKRVIEFACGEGSVGVILSKLGCIYCGADIAPSAVDRAKQALAAYPAAKVLMMDMVNDRADGSFDAAIDVMGLHMLVTDADRKKYLANVYASIKPGAPVLFLRESYAEDLYSGEISSVQEWAQIIGADFQTPSERQVTNNGITYTVNIPLVPSRAKNKAGYIAEMTEAGFTVDRFIDLDPSREIWRAAAIYVHKDGKKID